MMKYFIIIISVLLTLELGFNQPVEAIDQKQGEKITSPKLATDQKKIPSFSAEQVIQKLYALFQNPFTQTVKIYKKISFQKSILLYTVTVNYDPKGGFTFKSQSEKKLPPLDQQFSNLLKTFKTDIKAYQQLVKEVTEVRFSKANKSLESIAQKFRVDFSMAVGGASYAYVYLDAQSNVKMVEFLDPRLGHLLYEF